MQHTRRHSTDVARTAGLPELQPYERHYSGGLETLLPVGVQLPRTTRMLKCPVPTALQSRSQSGRNISMPRAALMSPRSMMFAFFQPNHSQSRSLTSRLASASLPQRNKLWSPGTRDGCTMTSQFIVLSAFTTRVLGNSRCTCSPSESVLQTVSDGGMPVDTSSGLATSMRIFPRRLAAPA